MQPTAEVILAAECAHRVTLGNVLQADVNAACRAALPLAQRMLDISAVGVMSSPDAV